MDPQRNRAAWETGISPKIMDQFSAFLDDDFGGLASDGSVVDQGRWRGGEQRLRQRDDNDSNQGRPDKRSHGHRGLWLGFARLLTGPIAPSITNPSSAAG